MQATERVRVFLVGRRLYQLACVADDAAGSRFFDSFKLTR